MFGELGVFSFTWYFVICRPWEGEEAPILLLSWFFHMFIAIPISTHPSILHTNHLLALSGSLGLMPSQSLRLGLWLCCNQTFLDPENRGYLKSEKLAMIFFSLSDRNLLSSLEERPAAAIGSAIKN